MNKKLYFLICIVILSIIAVLNCSFASAYDWNFSNSSDYIYNSSEINVTGGSAQLIPQILSSSNTGWWHMNELSGTTISDSSGNGNTGNLVGSQNWVSGKLNNAFQFTGSNYFDVAKVYGFTNAMTLSLWVNFNTTATTQGIIGNWAGGSGTFLLYLSGGNLVFDCGNATTEKATADYSVSAGQWYYIVATYDGNLMKLYVNGTNVRNQTLGGNIASSVRDLWIGKYSASGLNGTIDEVYIADRVILQNEITSRYNNGTGTEAIGTYSTSLSSIQPKNNFSFTNPLGFFNETAIKTGSNINYCISSDATNFKYWNGTDWVSSVCNSTQSNSASVINSNIGLFANQGNFTFKAVLHSNDGTNTPILDNVFVFYPPPNITFVAQVVSDINSLNVVGNPLNITYNITSNAGLNQSSIFIYYKTNKTNSDIVYFENGTSVSGFRNKFYTSNSSDIYLFRFFDNQIYPATYNINETLMENTTHNFVSLTSNDFVKVQLLNVSSSTQYNFFEIMANSTVGANAVVFFYCNNSYVSGVPSMNNNCYQFNSLSATTTFNHIHTVNSAHQVITMAINTTTGTVGTVKVTSISYFLIQGQNNWNYYYINNTSRTDAIAISNNLGVSYSAQTFTIDSHLHQFSGTDTLWYYVCTNDGLGNPVCSALRSDLMDLGGLPPEAPIVYNPFYQGYHYNISINYTASISPNNYPIIKYNISLMNQNLSFNQSIISNNSVNLGYIWNSSIVNDGYYYIKVTACDNNSLCADGFSSIFLIDNTPPYVTLLTPLNNTMTIITAQNFSFNASDNFNLSNATLNIYNSSGGLVNQTSINIGNQTSGIFSIIYNFLFEGIYHWMIQVFDTAGNFYNSLLNTITIIPTAPNISIIFPVNSQSYNYTVTNITYAINGTAQSCWYSLNLGNTNISTSCGSLITGLASNEGTNIWRVYINNSIGNETYAQTIFNSTCSNPNVTVTTTSFPYIDVNATYTIVLTPFVSGNSNIRLQLNDSGNISIFNFTHNMSSYYVNLVFSQVGNYSFVIYGDNICPTIVGNITGTFLVRKPYYITIEAFTDKNNQSYINNFAYVTAEFPSMTYSQNGELFLRPLIPNTLSVFHAPYINGVATLKLWENTNFALRIIDGQISFPSSYSAPNITKSYGTNVYLGEKSFNGSNDTLLVYLSPKDLHPYFWLLNVLLIIGIILLFILSAILLYAIPQYPWVSIVTGVGFSAMLIFVRIVLWLWLGL